MAIIWVILKGKVNKMAKEKNVFVRYTKKLEEFLFQIDGFPKVKLSKCELEEVHSLIPIEEHPNLFLTKSKDTYLKAVTSTVEDEDKFLREVANNKKKYFPKVVQVFVKGTYEKRWVVVTFLKLIPMEFKIQNLFHNQMKKNIQTIFVVQKVSEQPVGMKVDDGEWVEGPHYMN